MFSLLKVSAQHDNCIVVFWLDKTFKSQRHDVLEAVAFISIYSVQPSLVQGLSFISPSYPFFCVLLLFQSKTFYVRSSTPVSWPPRALTVVPPWAPRPTCARSSTSTSISTSISTNTPTSTPISTPSRPSPTPSCPPQHRPWCVPLPEMWG